MSAAEAEVIRFLLVSLGKQLTEYWNLKAGAGDEFDKLNNGLLLFEAFLKDEAKTSKKKEVRKEIERRIRELVYESEDLIETYLTKMAAAKEKNVFSRFVGKFSINLEKRFKSLNEKVEPIEADIKKEFGEMRTDDHGPSSRPEERQVLKDQLMKLDKVVDFEDEETIKGYLKTPKDKLNVICITGMTGLGKSTLAWKIYNDEKIVEEFKLRIWIHVSQKFNSWDVFLDILRKVTPQGKSNPRNAEELSSAVYACLANNKFLLVLDDVWSTEDWQVIEKILPDANENGKVLVTSRHKEVGVHASTSRVPHELNGLKSERSWELLQLNVFGNLQVWPQELRGIGQSIANQCGGVPLTIVVIGGILKDQLAKTRVLDEEMLKGILEDVSGKSLEGDTSKRISKAIELSYDRLPNELRECFLYMGMFPENEDIPASTLTELWIAEGFIRREDRKSLEKTAEKLLNDLISMNLLMVGKKHLHQVKTCRVHDMIREFCISKAKEENLFQLIKESEGRIEPPVSDLPKFHRLSLHSDPCTFLSKKPKGPRVRSFLCFCKETIHMKETHVKAIPEAFSSLRVLNCHSIKFGQFPNLTKLILLKHVTLSIENLDVLPKEISQLLNLQTLVVETKSYSFKVKANIWKMFQLRHVKTRAAMLLHDNKSNSEADGNLQTLTRLSPDSFTAAFFERASHLKTLGVKGKLADRLSTISLQRFTSLETLKLVNDLADELASKNPLLDLQSRHFPLNLKKLTLSKTYLLWRQHMPILAQIATLEVLKLKENAFIGVYWQTADNSFQTLQFLLISDSELVNWQTSTDYFPRLKWLKLRKCRRLVAIPDELEAKLEKLEIEHVQKSVVDSAKKIEERKKRAEQNQQSVLVVPFLLTIGAGCA